MALPPSRAVPYCPLTELTKPNSAAEAATNSIFFGFIRFVLFSGFSDRLGLPLSSLIYPAGGHNPPADCSRGAGYSPQAVAGHWEFSFGVEESLEAVLPLVGA